MQKLIWNITIVLGVVLAGALTTSCYDDKGNYDYIRLDEIVIDTTGLGVLPAYSLLRYDSLFIPVKIRYNGKEVQQDKNAPLDYVWTIYTTHTGAGLEYVTDTIGYSPDLNAEITSLAGNYQVQLTVTHRETKVEHYFKISCQVEESITAGWMLLYERADRPGTSDVGLVVNSLVKKNITQGREYWNLYTASNQAPLEGTPVRIQRPLVSLASGTDQVICLTNKQLVSLNNATFEKVYDFEHFFYTAPATVAPKWYGPSGRMMNKHFLINDNKIHTVSYVSVTGGGNYMGDAKSADYGELAAWGSDVTASNDAVVYDQTNGRFYHIIQYTSQVVPFAAQNPDAAFDVNRVGMKMLMADWGRAGGNPMQGHDYAIMEKGNERYLIIANFCGNAADANVGLGLYNITNSPGILKATSMAAAFLGEYVLYGAGNKVYNLAYNSSTTAIEAWTAPAANEEVTCVRLQKFYFASFMQAGIIPNANQVVHIATYNKETREGKLYQYRINPASGEITGEPFVYTVPGKVGDMAWKYVMEM